MEEIKNQDTEIFDRYIREVEDQELKGILLKLKNELRKPDTPWEVIKTVLQSLLNKNKATLIEIVPFILK